MKAALNPAQLAQFSIAGRDFDFDQQLSGKIPASGVVSLKSNPGDKAAAAQLYKKTEKSKKRTESSKQRPGGNKKRKE